MTAVPLLTVRETLRYFAELKGLSRAEASANTAQFLNRSLK